MDREEERMHEQNGHDRLRDLRLGESETLGCTHINCLRICES